MTLLNLIRQTRRNLAATEDPALKSILQLHLDSLKLHQIHYYKGIRDLEEVKDTVDSVKKSVLENLDAKVGPFTMKDIQQRPRKEPKNDDNLKVLFDRVGKIEERLTALNEHSTQQTDLLEKLVAALKKPSNPKQLDDDKKGEKESEMNVQVTKVLVPTITISKPPTPPTVGIDLIHKAAAKLRAQAQQQQHQQELDLGGEAEEDKEKCVKFSTKLQPLKAKDYTPSRLLKGESSRGHGDVVVLVPKSPLTQITLKRPMLLDFPPSRPDTGKLLEDAITNYKNTDDAVLRGRMAIIYIYGERIMYSMVILYSRKPRLNIKGELELRGKDKGKAENRKRKGSL